MRTTLDPKMQVMARKALADGPRASSTRRTAIAAPVSKIDMSGDWGVKLADVKALVDIAPWRLAVVLETSDQSARDRLAAGARARRRGRARSAQTGIIPLDGVKWAKAADGPTAARRRRNVTQVLKAGDVDLCRAADRRTARSTASTGCARCRKSPARSWRWIRMTGRVLAMVGGFSFDQSQFNRATQAYAPAGLVVQAVRLCGGARQRLHAVDGGDGRADRDRPGSGRRRVAAGELFDRQVLRAADAAHRHRAVAQH